MKRLTPIAIAVGLLFATTASAEEFTSRLVLSSNSYIAFENQELLTLPQGSSILFHFKEPLRDGSVPFTISPADVQIPEIDAGRGATLTYKLMAETQGTARKGDIGLQISFPAWIEVTLTMDKGSTTTQ